MLYVIGGVPHAGKSAVRKQLLERYRISGIELETLRGMIDHAVPDLGMSDEQEIEMLHEKMWPWIQGFIEERRHSSDYFVLEGNYFTPETIVQFKEDANFKVCFMVYPEISVEDKLYNIRLKNTYSSDRTRDMSDEDLKREVEKHIETSNRYKKMCQLMDIEYFDTSEDFDGKIEEAVQYLIGR